MVHRHAAASAQYPGTKPRELLPALMLMLGVFAGLATPPESSFTPLFAAAPLTAAALLGLRATVTYGVAAIALISVLQLVRHTGPTSDEVLKVVTIGTVSLIAIGINVLVARGYQQAASARAIAEAVQRAMVPEPASTVDGLRLAARYRAANREALIGGDLYAVTTTPFGVRMILGDVRGKGLEATESVAVVLGCFREAAAYEPCLETIGARLEASLRRATRERLAGGGAPDESFVTAVLVEVTPDAGPATVGLAADATPADVAPAPADAPAPAAGTGASAGERGAAPPAAPHAGPESRPSPDPDPSPERAPASVTVRLLNFGHPAPLLLAADGAVHTLDPEEPALPLGLSYLGAEPPRADTTELMPGAILLLYTDGVTEARDADDRFYDPVSRLRVCAATAGFREPDQVLDWLLHDLARHGGAGVDDVALLAASRAHPQPPRVARRLRTVNRARRSA